VIITICACNSYLITQNNLLCVTWNNREELQDNININVNKCKQELKKLAGVLKSVGIAEFRGCG
jgi:hypothetical protein